MDIKKISVFLIVTYFQVLTYSQYVNITPIDAHAEDEVTLIFNVSEGNGELEGAEKVYIYHGVVIDAADGTAWQNNWQLGTG